MTKDRARRRRLDPDGSVLMVVERSSSHPVGYAIVVIALHDGEWHTVRTFDNAHAGEEHHEHSYVRDEKQEPVVTHGPVNDVMASIENRMQLDWPDIVSRREQTWDP